jgi:hypothetical protein
MKSNILTVLLVLSVNYIFSQNKTTFEVEEILIERKYSKRKKSDKKNKPFYEDSEYIVTTSCKGEWGGSIWFENKKTGIIYSCESTCPKSIHKIDNKYIVTNSLAHMYGVSEIIQIDNPNQLSIFKKPQPRSYKNGKPFYYVVDLESKSRQGVKTLWSEHGTLIILSFLHNQKLYHITIKEGTTLLTTLENNELVTVCLISKARIWSHHTINKISKNHTFLYLGRDFQKDEYIEIKDSKIKLVRYK